MAKIETTILLSELKVKTEFCIKEAKKFLKQNEVKLNNRPIRKHGAYCNV